eukprot:GHVR01046449.1.p3 GENE.GHVR01046449.1~~GHVR01046449.1.p3  ORF type:complete len:136 (-),score=25.93 GHVR01046449.1:406-813(-)
MVARERSEDDVRPKASSRVERSSGVVDRSKLGHEEGQTDANRRKERRFVLLGREEQDREHQEARAEHLQKEPLGGVDASNESCPNVELLREDRIDHRGGSDTAHDLRESEDGRSERRDDTDEKEAPRHGRVEKTA